MEIEDEQKLRALLERFQIRADGDVGTLIDRISKAIESRNYCIQAYQDIAQRELKDLPYSAKESAEFLVTLLPAEYEQQICSQLPPELSIALASLLHQLQTGQMSQRLGHLEKVSAEFAFAIDKELMPKVESLERERAIQNDLMANLSDCNDRRGRMLNFVEKIIMERAPSLQGWVSDFDALDEGREENHFGRIPALVDEGSAFAVERIQDCSRLIDYIDKVCFFRESDGPTQEAIFKAIRLYNPTSFVFLGRAPNFMVEMSMMGYKAYTMSAETEIPVGALLGKYMDSSIGRRWMFDIYGISECIKLN